MGMVNIGEICGFEGDLKKGFDVDKQMDLNTPSLDFTTKNGDFINKHDGIVGIWWDNDEFNMELRTRRRD